MLTDLKNFILWIVFVFIVIGIIDTIKYTSQPIDNDSENIIVRPSYDRSFMSEITGKQE